MKAATTTEQHRGNGSSTNGSTSSSTERNLQELEREVQDIQQEMGSTLRQLEERLSPRAMLEQLMNGAQHLTAGSSNFVKNLGATVRDNPIPVMLLATGVVSLLASGRRAPAKASGSSMTSDSSTIRGSGESIGERASELTEDAKQTAEHLQERLRGKAVQLGSKAAELGGDAKQKAMQLQTRVREGAADLRERGSQLLQDEPMLVIGAGVLLGAIIGASFPPSSGEQRVAGSIGGSLGSMAQGALGKLKETVHEGAERIQESMEGMHADQEQDPPAEPRPDEERAT